MIPLVALNLPVFVPNPIAIRRRAGFVAVTAIDALAKNKLLRRDVRKRKVGHVKFTEQRLLFYFLLSITHAEAKEGNLIAVAFAAFALQMTRVVPPLGLVVGMGIMIRGESELAPGKSELIGEAGTDQQQAQQNCDQAAWITLPLPSPVEGEG